MRTGACLLILALGLFAGCRSTLPRSPSASPADALAQITDRAERVHALSAQGVMTVRSTEGDSIRLNVALAARGPDRMRLRAWKLGHAALDLTVRGEEAWLWTGGENAGDGHEFFGRFFLHRRLAWHVLRGGVPDHPDRRIEQMPGTRFRVSIPMRGNRNATLVAEVDRPTLTVRAYRLLDSPGGTGRRIRISAYRLASGAPLPAKIRAEGERGTIALDLEKVIPNPDLEPAAYKPSPRARKLQDTPADGEPQG